MSNGSTRTIEVNDPHGVLMFLLIAVVAVALTITVIAFRSPAPALPPAVAVMPAARPYQASCPWCGRAITVDPSRPTGQALGRVVGDTAK